MSLSPSFRRFTVWCAALTYLLIVVGGVVRTTGSGDACPDWPLCYGQIIPPFQLRIWIEWTHRLVTSLVYSSVLALVVWVSLRCRAHRLIFWGAWLAFFLLIFQIVLGGLVVILQLPPALVGIHLANALLIFATLLAVVLQAYRPWSAMTPLADPRLRRLIILSAAAVYVLIFSGSVVVGTGSSGDCVGWPLCSGDILPAALGQAINLTHRYFAAAVGILLFYVLSETLRRHRANRLLRRAAHTAIGLFAVQVLIGGINVLTQFTPFWNALHLAAATAVWGAMFVFALIGTRLLGSRPPAREMAGALVEVQP